jgi:hypothetical protein
MRCSRRQARHRHQHRRQGAEEAARRDQRSRIRRDDGGEFQAAFFFLKEAGKHLNDNGKICTLVTSLLGAFTPFCGLCRHQGAGRTFHARSLENSAPRHFGDGDRPRPDGHAVLLSGGRRGCVAYHKTAAALSSFTRTGLTDIHDIVPWIRFLVSDGWWMTGQTILVNGGYTTK